MEPYASTERSDWDHCLCWLTVTGSYNCDPRVGGLGTWGARVHIFGASSPELICVRVFQTSIKLPSFSLIDLEKKVLCVCVKIEKNDGRLLNYVSKEIEDKLEADKKKQDAAK